MSLERDRHRTNTLDIRQYMSNVLVPECEEELYILEIDSSLIIRFQERVKQNPSNYPIWSVCVRNRIAT